MTYTTSIVCLANSWKKGGACVAGLQWPPDGSPTWIRPVSGRQFEQLEPPEHVLARGRAVTLLDVVELSLLEHRPHGCQTENHLIDTSRRWRHIGKVAPAAILPFTKSKGPLWLDGWKTGEGLNDKIPAGQADALRSSLVLVKATNVLVRVVRKVNAAGEKNQARLRFALGSGVYDLSVTDPVAHQQFAELGRGEHSLDHPLALCVSLSEPSLGYRYKLAAGVIHLPA